MPRLLNWDLMKVPENYVIVFFSVSLFLIFLHLLAPEEGTT